MLCRNLGDVSTNHHAVTLRVKSLLDSCNEGLDEHDNSDQSSTCADEEEEEAGSIAQVGGAVFRMLKRRSFILRQELDLRLCLCLTVWHRRRGMKQQFVSDSHP